MARVERKLRVGVPVDLAFELWSQPREYPNFMAAVSGCERAGNGAYLVHTEHDEQSESWTIEVDCEAPHKVRWFSRDAGRFHAEVMLRTTVEGCEVYLSVDYEPRGVLEHGAGGLLRTWDVSGDLLRFKIYAEGVLEEQAVGA